ncbi:MAG: hypothetical protein KKC51_03870 [Verrucomicrobia bacterium]|nr:hypothetical protein [Verrucomicrobiota bacterium]
MGGRRLGLILLALALCPPGVSGQEWIPLRNGLLSAARVQVRDSTTNGLTLLAEPPGFVRGSAILPDGRRYDLVQDAAGARGPVGHPDLPVFAQWILVPNGCEVRLEVAPVEPVVFTNITLAPVQPPPPDSGDSVAAFVRDETLYQRDADYPGVLADFDAVREIRGQATRLVRLYPYQYNPQSRILRVYPRLEVRVIFSGTPVRRDPRLTSRSFDGVFRTVPNMEAIFALESATEEAAPGLRAVAFGGATNGCELLIVCADAFTNAAFTLAEWKCRRGIATTVVTTNETGSATNQVRDYIKTAYSTWSPAPAYVLLLGDSDFIPPWYVTDHPAGERKNSTDIFYADMSEPFDWVPDLAVGRWPVETATQAMNWAQRVIAYESAPPDPALYARYYTNATLCASFAANTSSYPGYSERRFVKTTEDLRNYLVDAGYGVERIYAQYTGTNPTHWASWLTSSSAIFENDSPPWGGVALLAELLKPTFPWSGARTNIRLAVNSGTFLLTHRDHGNRTSWSKPVFTKATDVDGLTNGVLRPVVWSVNCQTGWFDNETDDAAAGTSDSDECFAEHWVRHPTGGAIGVLAPTRTSYSYYNDRLYWGLADAIWTNFLEYHGVSYTAASEPAYRMGDVLNRAKTYFLTKYSLGTYGKCTMEIFHCLGDPTLEMWTGLPQDLTVSHTGRVMAGATAVTVEVAQAGALVCCVYSNLILGTAEAAGGVAEVNLDPPPEGGGELYITVTLHNYLPYLGTAAVVRVDDGDNDGMPDWWEEEYLGSTNAVPEGDDDEDGLYNYGEWISGCHPMDGASAFAAGTETAAEPGAYVIQWSSVADRFYAVYRATNLPGPFLLLSSNIPATPPLNVYTDTPAAELDPLFYRLLVTTNAPP